MRRMQSDSIIQPPPYAEVQYPLTQDSIEEEPLPPPPPPIYEEETPRERMKGMTARERRDEMRYAAASRSTTSAASFTLSGSASITSSRGTDDSEEDVRRKVWNKFSIFILQMISMIIIRICGDSSSDDFKMSVYETNSTWVGLFFNLTANYGLSMTSTYWWLSVRLCYISSADNAVLHWAIGLMS